MYGCVYVGVWCCVVGRSRRWLVDNIHVMAGLRTLSLELDWDVARSSVTASLSGLHWTTASHFPRPPFFFLRLKKQQHLKRNKNKFFNLCIMCTMKYRKLQLGHHLFQIHFNKSISTLHNYRSCLLQKQNVKRLYRVDYNHRERLYREGSIDCKKDIPGKKSSQVMSRQNLDLDMYI